MGIIDRLGTVIRSYLQEDTVDSAKTNTGTKAHTGDPDYNAAMDELDELLGKAQTHKNEHAWTKTRRSAASNPVMPPELQKDFAELGLSPSAAFEECKAAYKTLLKKHHPDRHAGNPADMKKATEKSTRINAAYDRIGKWFDTKA
ncbi:hypothetical protein FACS1894200_02420 [Spirochaetia bacterium]|nr:hypothetical protein FACS1894200_02420 [Spirochaetia bacterium]